MPTEARRHQPPPCTAPGAAAHRPSSTQRGYTYRWQQYVKGFLQRQPSCQCGPECCPNGCHEPATCVDHIVPVQGAHDPRFWDATNHQGLTERCHNRKTARDRQAGLTRG